MGRPLTLEFDEDASIGADAEAVLGERGAEEIATELLEAGAIVGRDPHIGVEIEAVELGLTRPREVTRPRPARTGETSASGSGGDVSSAGSSWRRASSRPARPRTAARTCATPSSLGGGAG